MNEFFMRNKIFYKLKLKPTNCALSSNVTFRVEFLDLLNKFSCRFGYVMRTKCFKKLCFLLKCINIITIFRNMKCVIEYIDKK